MWRMLPGPVPGARRCALVARLREQQRRLGEGDALRPAVDALLESWLSERKRTNAVLENRGELDADCLQACIDKYLRAGDCASTGVRTDKSSTLAARSYLRASVQIAALRIEHDVEHDPSGSEHLQRLWRAFTESFEEAQLRWPAANVDSLRGLTEELWNAIVHETLVDDDIDVEDDGIVCDA